MTILLITRGFEDKMEFSRAVYCFIVALISSEVAIISSVHYEPNWESLDARPLPSWFDEGKLGIYIHWGVFSVPSYTGGEWFWEFWETKQKDVAKFMKDNYKPDFTYADFAPQYTAEFFNPKQWVELFKAAGMKYMVFVSKHHEGFTNFPSDYDFNWNAMDVGPNRDLLGELADAVRKYSDIHFGVYYSQFEWFNRLYLKDKKNGYKTQDYVWAKSFPVMYEIINKYKPDVFWSDGDWEAPDTYWNSTEFLAWLYNESPVKDTVVTNDRWGKGVWCKHGGYWTCTDRYDPGVLVEHKWENAMTLERSCAGYRRNADLGDYYTIDELLDLLARTISCGGNLLMNIGITREGTIIPIFQQILLQLGEWLQVNGEAVYSSKPWTYQNDTVAKNVWYTSKEDIVGKSVYAFLSDWPEGDEMYFALPKPSDSTTVSLLGYEGLFSWVHGPSEGITVKIPPISISQIPCIIGEHKKPVEDEQMDILMDRRKAEPIFHLNLRIHLDSSKNGMRIHICSNDVTIQQGRHPVIY